MKKRSFAILAMGITSDFDSPKILQDPEVKRSDGTIIDVPVSVQNFSNKEDFVAEMTRRALRLWELHESVVEENNKIEDEELELLAKMHDGELN